MNPKHLLLTALLLILLLSGCQTAEFPRGEMLADITNNVILPNHAEFVESTAVLETAVQTFSADLTEENLTAVQDAWVQANVAWMGVSLFRFGEIEDSLLHNRIDNRPPRTTFIDETVLGDDEISVEFLENVGSTSVGLGAVEYLIFAEGDVLAAFQNAETGARRLAYLQSATTYLHQTATELNDLWLNGYADAFIAADMDGGDLQGSMNMLVNRILEETEGILSARLGKPMGKRTNGDIRPDLAESVYADISLLRIETAVLTVQKTLNGGDGLGFDDYLDFLEAEYEGEPLSAEMNGRFTQAADAIEAIDEPLTTAVSTHPENVEAAYESIRQALVLLKVDMPVQLGITLTFTDNDGD